MTNTLGDFTALAADQVGVPYVFGGTGLAGTTDPGLDCSGLPYAVAKALGVTIPRTSESQFAGLAVTQAALLVRGDLVFYDVPSDTQPQPAHEAIWWDADTILQAPHTGEKVGFSAPLPYAIMGYRSLPFPPAPSPQPPPPIPQEDAMTAVVLPDGTVKVYAVSVATDNQPAGHLLEYTRTPGTELNSVIDITDQIGGPTPYLVAP